MTMLNAKNCSNLAEREGFEPSVPVTQYARLAIWCLRPLGHLSASKNSDCSTSIARAQADSSSPPPWFAQSSAGRRSSRGSRMSWMPCVSVFSCLDAATCSLRFVVDRLSCRTRKVCSRRIDGSVVERVQGRRTFRRERRNSDRLSPADDSAAHIRRTAPNRTFRRKSCGRSRMFDTRKEIPSSVGTHRLRLVP
jgi:hypothetical protein